jgi:acyl-CoA reductase-like NAD-dependent aldehyde dehydrogenase
VGTHVGRCADAGLAIELDSEQGTIVDVGDARFKTQIFYEPVGVVGAIIPWNYPLLMGERGAAPPATVAC